MTRKRSIQTTSPTAGAGEAGAGAPTGWPTEPPPASGRAGPPPPFRPLKVYAFGPNLGRTPINIRTIDVRYEPLRPGPIGERIAVIDYDAARDCFYDPVDLDDPLIAMNGGLEPSESDPRFGQQMVYAVASDTLRRVEVALGRTVRRRTIGEAKPLRVILYPHGANTMNAYSMGDRVVLGYFRALEKAIGRTLPGQTVFTCLSHDTIAHQMVHVLFWALRPDLAGVPGDAMALQETLADLTPLLSHLGYQDAVMDTVQRTAGVIYRSRLDEGAKQAGGGAPRILAEMSSANPLLAVAADFGEAIGQTDGIRSALGVVNDKAIAEANEPHQRGAIVLAAVCDALFSIYQRRTLDLFRIYQMGGGRIQGNDVPEPLALRLCIEVERIARRVFNMCWRAFDYCPAGSLELGDFLRAGITADFEYAPTDPWGLRDAIMQSFRLRGIMSTSATFFTEDALRWPLVDPATLHSPGPAVLTEDGVGAFVKANGAALGLPAERALDVYPIEQSRVTAPDDTPQTMHFTQVIGKRTAATLVFDSGGALRYAIKASR
jgi:hypothetical protein